MQILKGTAGEERNTTDNQKVQEYLIKVNSETCPNKLKLTQLSLCTVKSCVNVKTSTEHSNQHSRTKLESAGHSFENFEH